MARQQQDRADPESSALALRDAVSAVVRDRVQAEGLARSVSLPPAAQRRTDAKLALLRALDAVAQADALPRARAAQRVAERYAAGTLDVPAWAREALGPVSASSLVRWARDAEREGVDRLGGRYGNRRGDTKIDRVPLLREFLIGLIAARPHVRGTHAHQALRARFAGTDTPLPSLRAIERWMTAWKAAHAQTFTALTNPDAWKNKYMVAFGSCSADVARLNQRWEFDSTPADVMLTDGRHMILGVVDVMSRRGKLLVAKTSKATAIALLTRRALLDWGVPEEAKIDNGQDYVSTHVTRVFHALDIRQILCPPFQPWLKPHIERFFGTFSRDLIELLDGYIGHSVAERKAIEARRSFADRLMQRGEVIDVRLSAAELQRFADEWCENVYAHRPHAGLDDTTPFELAAGQRDTVRRITDERALDILLAEAPDRGGLRTVQKKGLALDNTFYIAPELEAYVGQVVQVRFDPADLGRVYVFGGPDLAFLCIAQAPERTGIDPREVAARAREQQKARVQNARRELKAAARAAKTDDIVGEILAERAASASKVAAFPAPAVAHTSAGLSAALDAAEARDRTPIDSSSLMSREEYARRRDAIEARKRVDAQPIIYESEYEKAVVIALREQDGVATDDEIAWLRHYARTNPQSAALLAAMMDARTGRTRSAAAGR